VCCCVGCGQTSLNAAGCCADDRDAEDAIKALQGKEVGGCRLSIEWTKESGKSHLNAPREREVSVCLPLLVDGVTWLSFVFADRSRATSAARLGTTAATVPIA
jgi:hypothetical protein